MDSQKTCKKCILMREALLEINEEIKKYKGNKDSSALCENIVVVTSGKSLELLHGDT